MLVRVAVLCALAVTLAHAQELPPELTQPVNDFASVIDETSAREMESLIRSLQQTTGDVVVVATVDTFAPYADIQEYAVKMFENRGRGIGERGRDNGLLILLAVKDREVRVEVGYELEQFITDGFSGETSRQEMIAVVQARRLRRRIARRHDAHHQSHRRGTQRHAAGRSARAAPRAFDSRGRVEA